MSCDLYRHFDASGKLLYVGSSLNGLRRLGGHVNSEWFDDIRSVTIERFESRQKALAAERAAIQDEKPKYNLLKSNYVVEDLFPDQVITHELIGSSIDNKIYSGKIANGSLRGLTMSCKTDWSFKIDENWNLHLFQWNKDHWEEETSQ